MFKKISAETLDAIINYTPKLIKPELVEVNVLAILHARSDCEGAKFKNKSNNWLKMHGYPMRRRRRV